jgi:effector protein SdbA
VSEERLKPLLLTSSGGGGHITAIMGIHGFLTQNRAQVELPLYNPVLFKDKPQSLRRTQVQLSISMLHAPAIGSSLQSLLSYTAFPTLPDKQSLLSEINSLSHKEEGKKRPYVDMLLDVYPAGYEYAAIWNIFQRNDKASELKKLVALQERSDHENESEVKNYFLKTLQEAAENHSAYTEIISTQPMGFPGLCNAILAYNHWLNDNPRLNAPKAIIHQYMTDLPTQGAVHFFNALANLSREQQEQMIVYAVGMSEEIIRHFFPNGAFFKGIFDIPVNDNPMVRPGLKNAKADHSSKFHKPTMITLSGEPQAYFLNADELLASILLGSQVGKDSLAYIETLLQNGTDRVFVFGGQSLAVHAGIEQIVSTHPQYKEKIIPLSYQSDTELAALMSRSNFIIIRGGGLCVMEQLAMNHSKEQTVLVHHADGVQLTSGISWEDDNVDRLITDLRGRGIHALKTTPERAKRDIAEARLVAAVKRYGLNELNTIQTAEVIHLLQQLPEEQLSLYVAELKKCELYSLSCLPLELFHYLKNGLETVNG